ncbi:MAG: hypothetical protein ACYS74_20940 [Planctomycetota bacterium]
MADASYSSDLDLGSTYYWRIDEVNDAETPTTWQGDLWNFTTQEVIVVEDFEDYNDWPGYEIYTMDTRTPQTAPRSVISRLLLLRLRLSTAATSPCRCSTATLAAPHIQRPHARLPLRRTGPNMVFRH